MAGYGRKFLCLCTREQRHLMEHATFARSLQVPQAIAPKNGSMVRLAPGNAEIIDMVPAGRLYLDGKRLVPEGAQGITERRKLAEAGAVFASVSFDEDGELVDGPLIVARGFSEPDGRLADESLNALDEAAEAALSKMKRRARLDDDAVEKFVGRAIRRACEATFGLRPYIDVTVLRS